MYLTIITFKNGRTIPFQSEVPYSADKVIDGWNLITDKKTGQIISFRGEEIVTIASRPDNGNLINTGKKYPPVKKTPKGRKPAVKTAITEE